MRCPTKAEMGAAVEDGVPVKFGLPTKVKVEGGYALLNLALAGKGDPDPWHTVLVDGDVVDMQLSGDRGLYVSGLRVQAGDMSYVLSALKTAPQRSSRHSAEANSARLRAGRVALKITDSMLRARVLDTVDGWSALKESSSLVDETKEGTLLLPDPSFGLNCMVLLVRCPSTARIYALRVPSHPSVSSARKWVMKGATPDVET